MPTLTVYLAQGVEVGSQWSLGMGTRNGLRFTSDRSAFVIRVIEEASTPWVVDSWRARVTIGAEA